MALVLKDRVKETANSPGTGTVTLLGASTGFQAFSVVGNGNTCYYAISDQGGPNWEVGIGTYTLSGTTLARTTVLSSSNGGSLTNFSSGTQDVFVTYPAEKGLWLDASGNAIGLGTPAAFVGTNITGTASGLTAGTVTTNANLTGPITSVGNATSIASQTGTGTKFVMDTSPTITGATLTTAALNGSLGATTPSTVVATSVGISTANAANALNITASTGTNSAYQTFTNTGNTFYVGTDSSTGAALGLGAYASGMYSSTKIVLQSGSASNSLTLDTSGNLGIGVTPSAWQAGFKMLELTGGAIGSNATSLLRTVQNAYYSAGSWLYKTTAPASFYFQDSGIHAWGNAPSGTAGDAITFTQAMTLDASGVLSVPNKISSSFNGSLGATTPSTVVATTITGSGLIRTTGANVGFQSGVNTGVSSASYNLYNGTTAASVAQNWYAGMNVFATDGSYEIKNGAGTAGINIDTSGNVGIGVPPSAWATSLSLKALQFAASGSLYSYQYLGINHTILGDNFYINNDGNGVYLTTNAASRYEQTAGIYTWYTAPSGTAGNPITFTQAMTLDDSGNFLVGTTSQINDGKICSQFNGDTTNGLILKTTRTAINSTYVGFVNSAGAIAGSVIQNGTTTVNYATSSDYRLKENIAPMTGALDKIALLKPVTYTWKNTDGELGEGFIAHELQEVCPLAVSGEKDAVNEDGSIKAQGIDTSFLVATLTAAIKEQQALITSLTARLEVLEAK